MDSRFCTTLALVGTLLNFHSVFQIPTTDPLTTEMMYAFAAGCLIGILPSLFFIFPMHFLRHMNERKLGSIKMEFLAPGREELIQNLINYRKKLIKATQVAEVSVLFLGFIFSVYVIVNVGTAPKLYPSSLVTPLNGIAFWYQWKLLIEG